MLFAWLLTTGTLTAHAYTARSSCFRACSVARLLVQSLEKLDSLHDDLKVYKQDMAWAVVAELERDYEELMQNHERYEAQMAKATEKLGKTTAKLEASQARFEHTQSQMQVYQDRIQEIHSAQAEKVKQLKTMQVKRGKANQHASHLGRLQREKERQVAGIQQQIAELHTGTDSGAQVCMTRHRVTCMWGHVPGRSCLRFTCRAEVTLAFFALHAHLLRFCLPSCCCCLVGRTGPSPGIDEAFTRKT